MNWPGSGAVAQAPGAPNPAAAYSASNPMGNLNIDEQARNLRGQAQANFNLKKGDTAIAQLLKKAGGSQ